ncbi:hypothetical protein CHUAL_003711 [Chamberlinius hualienensis]
MERRVSQNLDSSRNHRCTDNSVTEYSSEFELLWKKNVLSSWFQYIGHQGTNIIIMQCINQIQGEDGEYHHCSKRLRIRVGNYGNLTRHKEQVHHNVLVAEDPSVLHEDQCEFHEVTPDLNLLIKSNSSENSEEEQFHSQEIEANSSVNCHPKKRMSQRRFDQCIMEMYADGFPLHFTSKKSFKDLISNVDPTIKIKSRFYYKKCSYLLNYKILPLLKQLSSETHDGCCHFSLDIWKLNDNLVIGIKLHEITNDWCYFERTLHFKRLESISVEAEFQNCLQKYGISPQKVGKIVMDDSVKMTKIFNLSHILKTNDNRIEEEEVITDYEYDDEHSHETVTDDEFMSDSNIERSELDENDLGNLQFVHKKYSYGHQLQAVIEESLLADSVARQDLLKLNKVIIFFKQSRKWFHILKSKLLSDEDRIQQLECLNKQKSIWKSVLHGLQVYSNESVWEAVHNTLVEIKESDKSENVLSLSSVAKLLELSYLLNGLGEAVEYLISDGINANKIILIIVKVFKDVEETNVWYYHDLKKYLVESLVKTFEPILRSEEIVIATICDPRQKLRLFNTVQFGSNVELRLIDQSTASRILESYYEHLKSTLNHSLCSATISDSRLKAKRRKKDIIDEIDYLAPVEAQPCESEVEIYFSEPCVSNDVDVLQFWKQSTNRFPFLSKIAMRFLAIPTSSGTLKRDWYLIQNINCDKSIENHILFKEYTQEKTQPNV